jgi:hypothetical protein
MNNIYPYEVDIIVPLREKDEKFVKIQELIDAKQKLLIEKQKKLRSISKQNHFLESVKDDYANYYEYILKQKKDQIKALEILNEYIEDLTYSGKLTKYNIEDAKEEQTKILDEVKFLKKKLDSLMNY